MLYFVVTLHLFQYLHSTQYFLQMFPWGCFALLQSQACFAAIVAWHASQHPVSLKHSALNRAGFTCESGAPPETVKMSPLSCAEYMQICLPLPLLIEAPTSFIFYSAIIHTCLSFVVACILLLCVCGECSRNA